LRLPQNEITMENSKQLINYNSTDGVTTIAVNLANETVWLTLNDLVHLFARDKSVISRHIRAIFKEGELTREATVAKYATVQKEGDREITRTIEYFNLDVIISVGYRVKSKQGTNFRIWATTVLKEKLIENAKKSVTAVNYETKYLQLLKTINVAVSTATLTTINTKEATGILKILQQYAYALETLDKYDHQSLSISKTTIGEVKRLDYKEAIQLILEWNAIQNGGALFGREKDASFKSSLNTIYQTFDGVDLYPSIEEKASNLLYYIVKNHSFTDGNKRIAAGLFAYFLDKNEILFKKDGNKRIDDNALVAITIMIAESKSEEKEIMVKLVVNLINSNN
jgi:prophage maintenance system killer protein